MLLSLLLPALLAVAGVGWAQDRTSTLPPVTISAKAERDPVEKSYRRMVRGMDLFERRHALAPQADVRFRLLPRHPDTDMQGIRLDIIGDTVDMRVPIAPDDTFVLPRDRLAFDEDAKVVPNRRRQSMTWRTEIRTPGLPPGTRRLGDLRLECEVGMEAGLVSNQRGLIDQLLGVFANTPGYCERSNPHYLFFSAQPLFGVTLVAGQRRQALAAGQLWAGASDDLKYRDDLPYCDCEVLVDRSYFLPLGDRSWPDDTLVEFEQMAGGADDAVVPQEAVRGIVPGNSTRADVAAAFPRATLIRFDSGHEAWVDKDPPARRDPPGVETPERVILVDPSGVVAKVRVRPPGGQP